VFPAVDRFGVLVIGAGVVGMASARALQRAGHSVCVLDRDDPGQACSFGNAGVIATDHVLPLSRPGTLAAVPGMLLDARSPLYLKPGRLPALASWFARFAWACRPAQVRRGTVAMASLTRHSLAAWEVELASCGAAGLLRKSGMYSVYEQAPALAAGAADRAIAQRFGVAMEVLSGDELRQREPALAAHLAGAIFYPEVAHVLDPARVVQVLARAFTDAGGTLLRGQADGLRPFADGVEIASGGRTLVADQVVVAAGIGSRALCRMLGFDPPLVAEMGYHITLPEARARLRAPVASAAGGFIVTPMDDHLRVAGTVEFAREAALPDWRRAATLAHRANALFRTPLPPVAGRWHGCRPTLPDFLPAIGRLPGQPRVLAAFGHQHIGLTTAALTGQLIADLIGHVPTAIDVAAFAPDRFGRARQGAAPPGTMGSNQ